MSDPAAGVVAWESGPHIEARTADLDYHRLPDEQVIGDSVPMVGERVLGDFAGVTVGVWEIEPSVSSDVEIDEVFVVLSGDATVQFDDGTPDLELGPGSVVHVRSGQKTRWIVRDTLRKIFIAAPAT
ncbi:MULTISPECIES: cupin domain-containing protein [unclassified Rhodococcus (in: high G+C Gram-positive bacteria)]|uniref:cupin domain-containing protein n=1 Tax=unclassified Rhodococcus (in: high G+C Gram-positive bacteria) TaxID=192944 RepID=UPI0002E38204|nr:cupin domain-containing protein [Rhodococcus sp. DK17]